MIPPISLPSPAINPFPCRQFLCVSSRVPLTDGNKRLRGNLAVHRLEKHVQHSEFSYSFLAHTCTYISIFIVKTTFCYVQYPSRTAGLFLHDKAPCDCCKTGDKKLRSPSEEPFKLRSISDEGFTDNALFISSVQGFCLKCFLTISTQMAGGERGKKKKNRLTVKGENGKRQAEPDLRAVCANGFCCSTQRH